MNNFKQRIDKWAEENTSQIIIVAYISIWIFIIFFGLNFAALTYESGTDLFPVPSQLRFIFNFLGFLSFIVITCFMSILANEACGRIIQVQKKSNTD